MKALLTRFPVLSAVLITVADAVIVGLAVTPLVPPVPRLPDFIALCVIAAATALLVTALGWWRVVGCNRAAEWRNLWLGSNGWSTMEVSPQADQCRGSLSRAKPKVLCSVWFE